jgi:hypothetical protein
MCFRGGFLLVFYEPCLIQSAKIVPEHADPGRKKEDVPILPNVNALRRWIDAVAGLLASICLPRPVQ